MLNIPEYLSAVGTQFFGVLPSLLLLVVAAVFLLVRRSRAPRAARLALWCLAGMMLLTLAWLFLFPAVIRNTMSPLQSAAFLGVLGVIRSVIDAALLLGVVVAVLLDRPQGRPAVPGGPDPT